MIDEDIIEAIDDARRYKENEADELIIWLFDRTPITPEILAEEGAVEDTEAECWRLDGALISNDDGHWHVMSDSIDSVNVKTLGDIRRAMTIGKDW